MSEDPTPYRTPLNLSPMEKALLESLQQSAIEHDRRLTELEQLLNELTRQSESDSESDRQTVKNLLDQLKKLDVGLKTLTERVEAQQIEAQSMRLSYEKAASAFNSMSQNYELLVAELDAIKRAAS
jgi:chromosome segregation ATPase